MSDAAAEIRIRRQSQKQFQVLRSGFQGRQSHLRLLVEAGAVRKTSADTALGLFDEVRAMTWRLLNRTK